MMIDAYNGVTSQGVNPLKPEFTTLSPNHGAIAYDLLSLGANLGSLSAKVPVYAGATDGITRTGSISINATLANSTLARALRMDGWTIQAGKVAPYTDTIKRTVK